QARDQGGRRCCKTRHPRGETAAMKRCAQCHGKLGLGVRSRFVERALVCSRSLLFGPLRSSLQAGATPTHVADAPSSLAVIHTIDCPAVSTLSSGPTAASGTPWPISAAVASAIIWHGCFDA